MAYVRGREQELTGYQEREHWQPNIDLQCDFVMVYGIDDDMPERVKEYKDKGYRVHLMTGISWGEYQDYLYGKFDGRNHWDESQMDRSGNHIKHGKEVPYMSPSVSFAEYLTEKLKKAVDAGVEAIHMEEPEFWDRGGYSTAFQREYLLYYKESWQAPDSCLDARYKCSKLKAYLYARTLEALGNALKEYALVTYKRVLRFYVPTHSLLNYTQWKIISPEGKLIEIPCVDGYIAQVWTGTSRSANVYEGVVKERTFETAYLEYGIMQELVKGTGRQMWFLHDPIEDSPEYTWEDYRRNYLKTVTASLLHPGVSHYEICPWPKRVFDGVFPRKAGLAGGTIPTDRMEGAKEIPKSYATLLAGMIQMLGDMDQEEYEFDGFTEKVGILMADSGLYQRSFPDGIIKDEKDTELEQKLEDLTRRMHEGEDCTEESRRLMGEIADDENLLRAFIAGGTFPQFYGMALPLLKYGLPVRPALLDNIRRYPDYFDGYRMLVLSYEYMKPESPDVNHALASWVKEGGILVYIGDDRDPYHEMDAWWNRNPKAPYQTPAQHLFLSLGLPQDPEEKIYRSGQGKVMIRKAAPAELCLNREYTCRYRSGIKQLLSDAGCDWKYTNCLALHRGPYLIADAMDETDLKDETTFEGLYSDMLTSDYRVIQKKSLQQGENTILFDYGKIKDEEWRIIGTSARVLSLDKREDGFTVRVKAADRMKVFTRIRLPRPVEAIEITVISGQKTQVSHSWDERTRTELFTYDSENQELEICGSF